MKSIYKYTIEPYKEKLEINGPIVRFLSVQMQRGKICVWAEVDTSLPERHFGFLPIGTGWNLDEFGKFEYMKYLGTVQECGGDLIWHMYYIELKDDWRNIVNNKNK